MMYADVITQLKSLSILPTRQRLAVASIFFAEPQHLSAEAVMERLQSSGHRVSKATVYNTLNLFADKGLAGKCLVDAERVLYDSVTAPHHHVLNIDTGELRDIPRDSVRIESLPELPENAEHVSSEVLIKVRNA